MGKKPAQRPAKEQDGQMKKLTFIAICRWLPHNKKSPLSFFLKPKGFILHESIVGNRQHSKVLLTFQQGPVIGV